MTEAIEQRWIINWMRKGWMRTKTEEVKNVDIGLGKEKQLPSPTLRLLILCVLLSEFAANNILKIMKFGGEVMLTRKCIFLISCLIITILSGCNPRTIINKNDTIKEESIIVTEHTADLITIPDKIIFYHQGKETLFDKNDNKFKKIISMIVDRANTIKDISKMAISRSDIETLKQKNDVLEFSYLKEVEVNWRPPNVTTDFQYKFKYNSIIFPLSGEWNKFMIFLPIQNGPLNPMGPVDEIQKYLNQ